MSILEFAPRGILVSDLEVDGFTLLGYHLIRFSEHDPTIPDEVWSYYLENPVKPAGTGRIYTMVSWRERGAAWEYGYFDRMRSRALALQSFLEFELDREKPLHSCMMIRQDWEQRYFTRKERAAAREAYTITKAPHEPPSIPTDRRYCIRA